MLSHIVSLNFAPYTCSTIIINAMPSLPPIITIIIIIIIIHCLTSDLDPYWAHADYSLYTYREKTLFKKTL